MSYKRSVAACLLTFFLAVSFLDIAPIHALTPSNGLQITPAITQIMLQSNEDTVPIAYTVTNLTNQPITVALGTRDFGAFSQSGSITLYGSGYDPTANPHGIQMHVAFPASTVTIGAKSSQQITVGIHDTTKLAPGGHYGAILFSPQNTFSQASDNRVNLNTSIAGLVFLTTAHGGTYGVSASMAHMSPIQFKLPSNIYLVYKNTGNTQTIPQGQLTLYDSHLRVLSTQVVNSSSGMILSEGSRIFQVQLPLQSKWYTLPGIYHLKLQYKDSEDASFKTTDQTFLYINWEVTLLVLAALLLLIYLVNKVIWKLLKRFTYFTVKRRKLKSISNSTQVTSLSGPKVMDVARPKRTKHPQ